MHGRGPAGIGKKSALRLSICRTVIVVVHGLHCLLLAGLFATGGFLVWVPAVDAQEVVVNPDVPKENLSRNALRAIFGMRLQIWPDGTPIRVFVLTDESKIHAAFAKKKLGIFPHQLRRAWDRLVYSGTGQAPHEVSSAQEMRAKIASTPGAIGYLPKEMINDNIRMVEIE